MEKRYALTITRLYGNAITHKSMRVFFIPQTGHDMDEKCIFSTSVQIRSNERDYLETFIANGSKGESRL